jgi:DNA-binding response OmpR family regulator
VPWRILIVDDEEDVRTLLRATLSEKYDVVEAHDGLDALEKLDRYEPDFIILDVMMPLMDGFKACEAIRSRPEYAEVPILFLTANTSKEDIKKGYGLGANLYLTKPFESERLLKNIEVHFGAATDPPPKRHSMATIKQQDTSDSPAPTPGSAEYALPELPIPDLPRVLAVDDDDDVLELIEASLEGVAEVVRAKGGFQAIQRLVQYQPDIMTIDIMLQKMNGYQLCQSVRANKAFNQVPILVCSAKSSSRDQQFAKRVGANDYLGKPFSSVELTGKVRGLMRTDGFRINPKTLSYKQIKEMEEQQKIRVEKEAREMAEEEKRKGSVPLKQAAELLQQAADEEREASTTRKKKLFGFGRK